MDEIKDDLKSIQKDLSSIRSDMCDIKRDVAVNTADLKSHMRRTDISEQRIAKMENWTLGLLTAILLAVIGAAAKVFIG